MRKEELPGRVFLVFHINFNSITYFKVRIVTEFVQRNDTIRFESDVHNHFTVVHCHHSTVDHFVFDD